MSVWTRLGEFLSRVSDEAVSSVIEAVRTVFEGDPETRRQVGFSVAMIALSAKMAKADGIVTENEVAAFREIFDIPSAEAKNVAKLYNLAKQDVAGYIAYAQKIRKLFPENPAILEDVMDGLFHIAKADGLFHENEMSFLEDVAETFHITGRDYERIRMRHIQPEDGDPYILLEADRNWDTKQLKSHYRKLVSENHPDRLIARGVPAEFLAIATNRLATINKAWDLVKLEKGIA